MTDWGIILERREELQTGKIKREGRMTGCVQIKRRQPKRPSWWKRQQQHSKVIFLLTTCFFLWAGPGLGGRSGSAMCRVTPPSCPWHDKHTLSLTHTYISCSWQKTRLKQKKTLQSNSLISAPKQNEAPWNNERAERRRCRNADRNETVIRSYHFLITQRVCAGAGDGVENRRLFCILIRRLIHTLYCYSFDYNRPACLPAPLSAFTEPHAAHETSVTPLPPLKLINQQFSQFL